LATGESDHFREKYIRLPIANANESPVSLNVFPELHIDESVARQLFTLFSKGVQDFAYAWLNIL